MPRRARVPIQLTVRAKEHRCRCEVCGQPDFMPLSYRELQVVSRLAEGMTLEQVGYDLAISPSTAKNHLVAAREGVGADSTAHLVAMVIGRGYLTVEVTT